MDIPEELATVRTVVPFVSPPVQFVAVMPGSPPSPPVPVAPKKRFAPLPKVIVVCVGPAPRKTTWPLLEATELPIVKDPAGTRTTVLFGAELRAALILAAVTVPLFSVLQAVVTQFAQLPLGIPPGIPAFVQSIALAGSRMPDHDCPYKRVEKSRKIEKSGNVIAARNEILLFPI